MSQFIRSSKSNPCPVCARTKDGDCRQNSEGTLVMCHTHQNSDPQVTGWKFFKTADGGAGWGVFGRREKPDKKPASGTIERSEYIYRDLDGHPLVKVDKIRYSNGSKTFYQSTWDGRAWVKGLNDNRADIPPYRIQEVQRAIANGEPIWMVEGEACADYLWSLGIPSTCLLKSAVGAYSADFKIDSYLKNGSIIMCPDKDTTGIDHADKVASLLGDLVTGWYYCFDNSLWHHLNKGDGADIEDEIREKQLTIADLMSGITERKTFEVAAKPPTLSETPKPIELSSAHIIGEIDSLIAAGVHNGRLRGEIACLAAKYKLGVNAIWDIYRERLNDADFEDDRAELKQSVSDLLAADRQNLNISSILPKHIAGAIAAEAALMGVRPETYLMAVLTATSAAQNSKTRISICPALGWVEPPNLYAAIVAESSQRKTPILKATVYKPFRKLEDEADWQYQIDLKAHELDSDRYNGTKPADRAGLEMVRPKPPTRKLHVISDPSAEGLINQGIAHPDKTLLYLRDELAGVFADLNKYRGGKGSDRQLLLETFNGASIKSVRASKDSQSHDELLLSIFGGIQPQVLQKIMGDGGDADGLWGRFLYVIQPTVAAPSLPPYGTPRVADLPALLGGIYESIDNLAPGEYQLSPEAYGLFSEYRDKLEAMRVDKNNCALLRHFVGKLQGITARIALNLHCFWGVVSGGAIGTSIDRATMTRAIEVAQFALAQIQILAAQVEQTTGESSKVYKLLQMLKEQTTATVREVQRRITRGVSDTARSLIDRAVQMGFVRWRDGKTVEVAEPQATIEIPQPRPPEVDREVTVPEIPKTEPAIATATKPIATENSIPPTTKVNDYVEYLIVDGQVKWIEIYFSKHSIAKDWKNLVTRWECQTSDLQMRRRKNRDKWLLIIKGLTIEQLEILLQADLWRSPQTADRQ